MAQNQGEHLNVFIYMLNVSAESVSYTVSKINTQRAVSEGLAVGVVRATAVVEWKIRIDLNMYRNDWMRALEVK